MQHSPASILFDPFGKPLSTNTYSDLVISQPLCLGEFNFRYGIDSRQFGQSTATGGTIATVSNEQSVALTVTASSGSNALLRTHTYFRYQNTRATRIRCSVVHTDTGQTNQIRRWGQFDANDGFFFQLSGTTLSIVRRTSTSGAPVDNAVAKSSWNYDKLDGSGPSGITLDITKINTYDILYSWLGGGEVQYHINGILVHQEKHFNVLAVSSLKTPVLPLAFDIINSGESTGSSFKTYGCGISVLSGQEIPGETFGTYNTANITVGGTETALLAIRNKTTLGGAENRLRALPLNVYANSENKAIAVRIIMNATITGGSWTSVDSRSGIEANITISSFTGGDHLCLFNGPGNFTLNDFFHRRGRMLRLDAFGTTPDSLLIAATNLEGGNTNTKGSLTWLEV